jgi:tetratricopeptide repeat protein
MTRPSRRARRSPSPSQPRRPPWFRFDAPAPASDPGWAAPAGWVVVAACAALLAWLAFGVHVVGDYFTESDFYGSYAAGARLAAEGRIDPARNQVYGPIYEPAVALVALVVPDLFTAAKVLSVAAAAITLAASLVLLRRRTGAVAALWAVLFLAANAHFLRYGFSASTESLALAFQSAALLAALASSARFAPAVAGLLAALAMLTRYSAAALVPATLACYAWTDVVPAGGRRRAAALYLGGFAALTLPWTLFSLAQGHLPGEGLLRGYAVFYGNPETSRNIQDLAAAARDSMAAVAGRARPPTISALLRGALEHLRLDFGLLLGWPSAATSVAGLLLAWRHDWGRRLAPLVICGGLIFASLVPVFYSPRYGLPKVPIYLALAGAAIASPRLALLVRGVPFPLKWVLGALAVALTARATTAEIHSVMSQMPVEVLSAGRVLRQEARPAARVMSRKGHIGYYAGLPTVEFPRVAGIPELAAHCRAAGVEYIFMSWYEAELRPEFWALLDTTQRLPGLTVVHVTEHNPSVLYRVGPGFGRVPAWFASDTLRRLQEARAQVRALPDAHAWSAHLVLGMHAAAAGSASEAADHFRQVTRFAPGVAAGWVGLGDVEMRLGRLDDAAASLRHALALDPADRAARVRLGAVELQAGRPQAAAEAWRPMIAEVSNPALLALMLPAFEQAGDRVGADAVRAALARAASSRPVPSR